MNRAAWTSLPAAERTGFQEAWYLRLADSPDTGKARQSLWLRFTLLSSANGFRKTAEVWAILVQKKEQGETLKTAIKQTFVMQDFLDAESGISIGPCFFSDRASRGTLTSKGRTISWELAYSPDSKASFSLIPEFVARTGLVKNQVTTEASDLRFNGTCTSDGQTYTWQKAFGMQGHLCGPKSGHSWAWTHCNDFTNQQGRYEPIILEAMTARARLLGGLPSPAVSSFYLRYKDQEYHLNRFWNAVHSRSQHSLTDWRFQAEEGDLLFRGHARAELRDFAGLTYEDTDGSLLFCANSLLSDVTLSIYRRGKLEGTFLSRGSAAFEVVSRHASPYVPLLV